MSESKERIIQRIEELSILLNGTMTKMVRANSTGRSSKVIEIEYDIEI
jgi:hypothetical protein